MHPITSSFTVASGICRVPDRQLLGLPSAARSLAPSVSQFALFVPCFQTAKDAYSQLFHRFRTDSPPLDGSGGAAMGYATAYYNAVSNPANTSAPAAASPARGAAALRRTYSSNPVAYHSDGSGAPAPSSSSAAAGSRQRPSSAAATRGQSGSSGGLVVTAAAPASAVPPAVASSGGGFNYAGAYGYGASSGGPARSSSTGPSRPSTSGGVVSTAAAATSASAHKPYVRVEASASVVAPLLVAR